MSLAQEKDDFKMVPRFKNVVCQHCKTWGLLCSKNHDDHWFIVCPKFFNYKMYGRPTIQLSDFSCNAKKQKDLRFEEP